MSQILSILFMMMNSMLFATMNHPMNMGITLMIQTLIMCIMMGMTTYYTWFSYILFLVFLGGMLVLFIYMTSIASNEMFMKTNYLPMIFMMTLIIGMFLMMAMDPLMMMSVPTQEMNIINNNNYPLSPLYNMPNMTVTLFTILYLLLTLIVIVYITKFNKGPLRPSN